MHPADEFDAFKALIDKGMPPADVAQGLPPRDCRRVTGTEGFQRTISATDESG
ncbi:MAG: hypothetical protein WCF22_16500 [Candidatus Sulfotelmatobacter sp.]